MLVKEYRIPLPMAVEEYRVAQLYMIQVGGGARHTPGSRHLCVRCALPSAAYPRGRLVRPSQHGAGYSATPWVFAALHGLASAEFTVRDAHRLPRWARWRPRVESARAAVTK